MKALKKLIISIVVIIAVLSVTIIVGYIYVRTTYGIDLFNTTRQLKALTKKVDEFELYPNIYGDNDFSTAKTEVNKRLDGLIVCEEGKGYNGYSVNFSSLAGKSMNGIISLTEKQVGAIAQMVLYEKTGGKIKLGEKELSVTIVQVDFSEFAENGSADFNVAIKLDLTPLKNNICEFPYKYFKKYIPNNLYVSSTVRVEKLEAEKFDYSLTHKSLVINNLSYTDTTDLFDTLNAILKIGTAKNLNMELGTMVVNALIGNVESPGFAYSMKAIGATTFNFGTISAEDWFIIY